MKPAGCKKDVLVAIFCGSLLTVAEEDFTDDEVVNIETDMITNNKLLWLAKEIQTMLNESDDNVKRYIRDKTRILVPMVLKRIKGVVNLELLAMYVLFINFVERNQKLDDDLQFLAEFDYMQVAEYLCSTKISDIEAEMFKLAYEVLGVLK